MADAVPADGNGRRRDDSGDFQAVGMLAYALVAYPVLNTWLGHHYPATPTFGAPCPTTIFTLGILTIARGPHPAILYVVPLLWAMVGGSAAFLLGVWPDLGLIVSAVLAAALWLMARGEARSWRPDCILPG